jgi:alkylhydroperoxidase family enzyme
MTLEAIDGGTDSQPVSGVAALEELAPGADAAFAQHVAVRPLGVHDEVLDSPGVRAFADQFRLDVSRVDEQLRAGLMRATGKHQLVVAQMIWIADMVPRGRAALDTLFGPSVWADPRRYPVGDLWATIETFMESVARLNSLDPTLTELVRLRGARQHHCRLSCSRRSVAALDAGATEATFDKVDDHAGSDLPAEAKAALALVDAMIWTPHAIPSQTVDAVRRDLTARQSVEVVLDVVRNSTNKIAVALGADVAEVSEGVQLFTTDADGTIETVESTEPV